VGGGEKEIPSFITVFTKLCHWSKLRTQPLTSLPHNNCFNIIFSSSHLWSKDGWSNRKMEEVVQWRVSFIVPIPNRQMKSRRMRWAGHVARMGEERKVYRVLMGKLEGTRPLGRQRHRWEDGIRMDLREIGWGSVDWIQLAQDRDRWRALVNTATNLRVLVPRY
jgi:hypothetical protein